MSTSRVSRLATFASLLGVAVSSASACRPDAPEDPSGVRAREVGAWSDASIAVVPEVASADAAAATSPTTQSDDAASANVVPPSDAAAVGAIADAAPALAPSGAVPLALLTARAVAATRPAPPPGLAPLPTQPGGLQNIPPRANCGGAANCGASRQPPAKAPKATVDVGLTPRGGVATDDARRVRTAVAILRARARSCVVQALYSDPTIPSGALTVTVTAPGGGQMSTVKIDATPSNLSPPAQACIARLVILAFGGDDKPAALGFPMRIWVEK